MVKKIVSGGQTGADRGGLLAGLALGIATGGMAPKDFRTENGSDYSLRDQFGLTESTSSDYNTRTLYNVCSSDATVILATKFNSAGTRLTVRFCSENKKPFVLIDSGNEDCYKNIVTFLKNYKPETLNIAGNRESVSPGIEASTTAALVRAVSEYNKEMEEVMSTQKSKVAAPWDEPAEETKPKEGTMNVKELMAAIKAKGGKGYSKMSKGELEIYYAQIIAEEKAEEVVVEKNLKAEVDKFMDRDDTMTLVIPQEVLHVEEDRVKIYFTQNIPEVEYFSGYKVVPNLAHTDNGPVVVDISYVKSQIRVSKNSPFYNWIKEGLMKPLTIDSSDPAIKFKVYAKIVRAGLALEEKKLIWGNLKKGDVVLASATLEVWKKALGYVPDFKNPFKALGTDMSPQSFDVTSWKNATVVNGVPCIKLRLIPDLLTEEVTLANGEKYGKHPMYDGEMITAINKFQVRASELKRELRHAELKSYLSDPLKVAALTTTELELLQREFEATSKPAKVQRIKCAGQLRIKGIDPVTNMPIRPFKGKIKNHKRDYDNLCNRFGYGPNDQDAFCSMSNIKAERHVYKPGDIIHIPITALRIVGLKLSDGKGSIGAQCVRGDATVMRRMLKHYGAVEAAKICKAALSGECEAIIKVLEADTDATWEDAPLMPAKLFLFARKGADGVWRVPMYTSMRNQLLARIYSYFRDHVIKCRITNMSFYLSGNEDLDKMEIEYFNKHGVWKNFISVPSTSKVRKLIFNKDGSLRTEMMFQVGRDPYVTRANQQDTDIAFLNGTADTIECSWGFMWQLFADVDGDTVKFHAALKELGFNMPAMRWRPVPAADEPKTPDTTVHTEEEYGQVSIAAAKQILKSQMDTGVLDNRSRQIIFEREQAGQPMTDQEITEMGDTVQGSIDGMKHMDQGADEDAEQYLIRKYGVKVTCTCVRKNEAWDKCPKCFGTGKMGVSSPIRKAPLEYKFARGDGGNTGIKGIQSLCMEEIMWVANEIKGNPHESNPYYDVLKEFHGLSCPINHGDSQYMKVICEDEFLGARDPISKRVTGGIISRLRVPKSPSLPWDFPWTKREIEKYADALVRGDGENQNFWLFGGILGHGKESKAINDKYGKNKVLRREQHAKLNERYKGYIDQAAETVVSGYVGNLISPEHKEIYKSMYITHLMLAVGIRGFGVLAPRENPERPDAPMEQISRGGSCFWCFPILGSIIELAKKVNPENPYFERTEAAVKKNLELQVERELLALAREIEEEEID